MAWFKHKQPREYIKKLTKVLGQPTGKGKTFVVWENPPKPYTLIKVVDEYVKHDFPALHHDFVYSYVKMSGITPEIACRVMKVSGSILIDLLNKEVAGRCANTCANASTLSFVDDVIKGKVQARKSVYAKYIKEGIMSRKYKIEKLLV